MVRAQSAKHAKRREKKNKNMREKVEQLIGEIQEVYDAELKASDRTIKAGTIYLGAAISNLKAAKDNLGWREDVLEFIGKTGPLKSAGTADATTT
jgi:hypothetical protein